MGKPNPIPNSKPFKKGQSGNPAGRPPALPDLDRLLAKVLGTETGDRTAAEIILQSLFNEAKAGNIQAAKLLLERGYGTVTQKIDSNVNLNTIEVGYGKPDAENNV